MRCEKCELQACCGCQEILDSCPCDGECHEQAAAQREHDWELIAAYRTMTEAIKRTSMPAFGSPISVELARIDKLETEAKSLKNATEKSE